MDLEMLRSRAALIRAIRSFFDSRGFLEVDTPLLAPDLIPETCLEVFETRCLPPAGSRRSAETLWLVPSPEIWMKKLMARHKVSIYQICRCFRNTESRGRLHSPEFTMLEYYTVNAGYLDSLDVTEALFSYLLDTLYPETASVNGSISGKKIRPPFLRITVEEAFRRWAGFSLYEAAAKGSLEAEARRLGLAPQHRPAGLDTAALYDLIFVHAVEPSLPRQPLFLMDYPAFVPCLAKNAAREGAKERWELYINGVELANCYSEETSPREVRRYFEAEGAKKEKNALVRHRTDSNYWKIFNSFPPCSGAALGLDRLIMVLSGRSSIDSVLPFPVPQMQPGVGPIGGEKCSEIPEGTG